MGHKNDYVRNRFITLKDKTLKNALSHQIHKHFPRIGGPRLLDVYADIIMEVIQEHMIPSEYLCHGQVVWTGISVDDPPCRGKKTSDTDLVALTLDLSTYEDIDALIARQSPKECLIRKVVRLCHQAYQQKALLSNSDLAELLCTSPQRISSLLVKYEKQTGKLVPRRANIHDLGTGLTHKRIICRKRYIEGKESHEIAQETYHSIEAVDRYIGQFDRVQQCRQQGMSEQETAHILDCTVSLVKQYLDLDDELGEKHVLSP